MTSQEKKIFSWNSCPLHSWPAGQQCWMKIMWPAYKYTELIGKIGKTRNVPKFEYVLSFINIIAGLYFEGIRHVVNIKKMYGNYESITKIWWVVFGPLRAYWLKKWTIILNSDIKKLVQ